jgi:predicted ATP-dependent endonuclease of OLD family
MRAGDSLITSVRIQRFKSIPDMTVPLGGLTLLVGPDNAGKSSVLQAIQFATSVCQSLELDNVSRWSGDERSGTL